MWSASFSTAGRRGTSKAVAGPARFVPRFVPRRWPLALLLALPASLPALFPVTAVAEPAASEAEAVVRETADQVLRRLRAEDETIKRDPGQIYGIISELILPRFDFRAMSRWVLGRHWKEADEDQRARFAELFQKLLVRTYGHSLQGYKDRELRVVSHTPGRRPGQAVVNTEVVQPDGENIPIAYRMRWREQRGWQVLDVKIAGISLLTTYRNTFDESVRRDGLDGLIARMAARDGGGFEAVRGKDPDAGGRGEGS